jgi:pantetheine-phosphate adenylyltransferase
MRRAAGMFGRLVLAVAAGHHKRTFFSLDERLSMAREVAAPLGNIEVHAFDGLLRDFVRSHGGRVVVRGLRTGGDFEYEFQMAGMNRSLMPEVETVFLTPGDKHLYTSSTFVREIATLGGEVSQFVSPAVHARIVDRVRERQAERG